MGQGGFDLSTDDGGIHGSTADLRAEALFMQRHCFRFLFA
jgi:hypothetical protein